MNYTEKYHLPQWEETDRIMRTDFNEAMSGIEAGLTENASETAAAEARAAAVTAAAEARAAAAAAAAQTKADAAYSPSQPPYVVGSYRGTGAEQSITVGFKPSFLIVANPSATYPYNSFLIASALRSGRLGFTANGFKVYQDSGDPMSSSLSAPFLNQANATYTYIAFR